MIIGFNPADMYAADHIRRVLQTYPGVFTGIGEFSIHKEFVSAKVSGDVASLIDPALDRIFEFTAESGLLSILHTDIHMPFVKPEFKRLYFDQALELVQAPPEFDHHLGAHRARAGGAAGGRTSGHAGGNSG